MGCFLECLGPFRPDPLVVAALHAIEDDPDAPATASAGTVPDTWLEARMLGEAHVEGVFAEVATADSLGTLNRGLVDALIEFHLSELDAATIRKAEPRSLTQRISRFVYEASTASAGVFSGLIYRSRLGDDIDNFALFEGENRSRFTKRACYPIDPADSDLLKALQILGVTLVA
jgi:hypothetical protein